MVINRTHLVCKTFLKRHTLINLVLKSRILAHVYALAVEMG